MSRVKGEHSHTECPICGTISDRTIYPFLDIVKEPELYDRIMIGDLFEYKCPACQETRMLPHSCVYKDSDENFFLYFVEEDIAMQIAQSSAMMAADPEKAETMPQMRWTETPGHLGEKAMLMSSGYDDRVIEIMKLLFEREAQESATVTYVGSCIVDLPDDGFRIVLFTDNGNYYNTVIAEQIYDDIERQLIGTPYYEGKGLLLIDRDWAIMAVDGTGDEPDLNGEMVSVAEAVAALKEQQEEEQRLAAEEEAKKSAEKEKEEKKVEETKAKENDAEQKAESPQDSDTKQDIKEELARPRIDRKPDIGSKEDAPQKSDTQKPAEKTIGDIKGDIAERPRVPEEQVPFRENKVEKIGKRERAEALKRHESSPAPAANPSGIASADDVFAMDANPFFTPDTSDEPEKKMIRDSFGFEREEEKEETDEEIFMRLKANEEDEERLMREMMGISGEDDE